MALIIYRRFTLSIFTYLNKEMYFKYCKEGTTLIVICFKSPHFKQTNNTLNLKLRMCILICLFHRDLTKV